MMKLKIRFSWRLLLLTTTAHAATVPVYAGSHFTERPDDPHAVYLEAGDFPVQADGVADDSTALQQAINTVQESRVRGIVFVPSGRYRLENTLLVWSGIRLIGFGPTRPVFVLGDNTRGFAGEDRKYMVHFVSNRPGSPDEPVRDANPGTFYSAMSNIDIEIGEGNPSAVGVRAHFAQHGFLSHMNFHIGSGYAGVEEVGNQFEDLHFHGGEFGISMHKPSPSWPFVLLDSTFNGQRRAAIETEEGGLTVMRARMTNVPTAVLVRPDRCEELWIEDSVFENVTGPAIVISDEYSARTQINLRNITCVDVPTLAAFRESKREIAGVGPVYAVNEFIHGLQIADLGAAPEIKTTIDAVPLDMAPPPLPTDVVSLPPMDSWVNLRTLGAVGDGETDDTDVIRAAIAKHSVIYLPSGHYRVSDTITLKPDTVLIGLDPITTQILIKDFTAAFQGVNGPAAESDGSENGRQRRWTPPPFAGRGAPRPMLEAPSGGTNVVTGIGLDTNGANNRAVALKWMAGPGSMVDDVRFLGGHGTYHPDGSRLDIYNNNRTADPDNQRKWDSQYWSLWVTDGGGGVFKNIWTPSPYAAAGMYVSNTETPGRVYAMSSEHHVRNEVKLSNVSNWRLYALQTEEERGESPLALPLEIDNCDNITVVNFFIYRVDLPVPYETGIRISRSRDLNFHGLHVYSPGKLSFDNTLVDQTRGIRIRAREIALLRVSGGITPEPGTVPNGPELEPGSRLAKLAGGFVNIDGLAADKAGGVFFVDQDASRIFRWAPHDGGLSLATDSIPQPVALAFDRSDNLLVVSRHGNVYAIPPGGDADDIVVLDPEASLPRPGATVWLPTNRWRDGHDWIEANTRREPFHYVSPDGSVFIPAPEAYVDLTRPGRGWGTIDLARTYALAPGDVGNPFYVSDEFSQKTWRFSVEPDGTLTEPKFFAGEGEAGTAVDADGNVYVCAGQIFVYDKTGAQIDVIEVPERPSALAFGGADQRTLFIAARTSLYSVATKAPGR